MNKQIEEMAKVMCGNDCEECAKESADFYGQTVEEARSNKCLLKNCAKALYNAGYQKVDDGSVVLTREAYNIIDHNIKHLEKVCDNHEKEIDRLERELEKVNRDFEYKIVQEIKQIRKETAREILQIIKAEYGYIGDLERIIAKQYGVEIEQ